LTFNQNIEPRFVAVTLTGPDERPYEEGDARIDGRDMTMGVSVVSNCGAESRHLSSS